MWSGAIRTADSLVGRSRVTPIRPFVGASVHRVRSISSAKFESSGSPRLSTLGPERYFLFVKTFTLLYTSQGTCYGVLAMAVADELTRNRVKRNIPTEERDPRGFRVCGGYRRPVRRIAESAARRDDGRLGEATPKADCQRLPDQPTSATEGDDDRSS